MMNDDIARKFISEIKYTPEFEKFKTEEDRTNSLSLIKDERKNAYIFNNKFFTLDRQDVTFMKNPNGLYVVPHLHEYIEIEYLYSGRVEQMINGKTYQFGEGTICVFNKNIVHSFGPLPSNCALFHTMIKDSFLNENLFSENSSDNWLAKYLYYSLYVDKAFNEPFIITGMKEKLDHIFEGLYKETMLNYPNKKLMMTAYLCMLCVEIQRRHTNILYYHQAYNLSVKLKHYNEILKYISDHYAYINLQAVARDLFLNEKYVCRIVKEFSGKTFTELVNRKRADVARVMLIGSDLTIKEIAAQVGFNNLNYFYRVFKKHYGLTPKQYRMQKCTPVILTG